MKKIICLFLSVLMVFVVMPVEVFGEEENLFEGKTVSILGDSISTFGGFSNNASSNSTIGNNAVYYNGQGGIDFRDTWWQQAIDSLGMDLLVNNSWSGSCVFPPRKGEESVGYGERCVNLHNDITGEEPDIIFVFLGTNDLKNYPGSVGKESDIVYNDLITENPDGSFSYSVPETTCEGYAVMLHKMSRRYPDSEIYCMTLLPRKNNKTQPTAFNEDISSIAERFGCGVIDLENCGYTPDNLEKYMYDGQVHPNAEGMDLITEAVVSAILKKSIEICSVELNLVNIISSNNAHACIRGKSYTAEINALNPKEETEISVTMDGNNITDSVFENGKIYIDNVTGNISVSAEAKRGELSFRWEYKNGELVSVSDQNIVANRLEKLRGTSENGIFSDTYYRTEHTVELNHNREWVIEWKGSGKGGFMLSDQTSAASSSLYFRRHIHGGYINVFGSYDGKQYNHYGLSPKNFGIDATETHIYRIANRVGPEGNMVYFYVDGKELGAMNNYYVGYSFQESENNWISGKDLLINYIGSSSHPISDYSIEYLQIWEEFYPAPADLNLDNSVDVLDVYTARLIAAKLLIPTEQQIAVGDVDSDGKITAIDANIIRKYILGIIKEIPVK